MENTKQVCLFDLVTKELVDCRQFHVDATSQQIGDCFSRHLPFSYYAPDAGETREFFFEDLGQGRQYLSIKGRELDLTDE